MAFTRFDTRKLTGAHSRQQWMKQLDSQGFLCFWCGKSMRDSTGRSRATKDHLQPISRGGSDFIENIVGACMPCNGEKSDRTAEEYLAFRLAKGKRISSVCTISSSTESLVFSRSLPSEVKRFTEPLVANKKFPEHPPEYWPERRAFLRWQVEQLKKKEAASLPFLGMEVKQA